MASRCAPRKAAISAAGAVRVGGSGARDCAAKSETVKPMPLASRTRSQRLGDSPRISVTRLVERTVVSFLIRVSPAGFLQVDSKGDEDYCAMTGWGATC